MTLINFVLLSRNCDSLQSRIIGFVYDAIRCCEELKLKPGDKKRLRVQFQMNRLLFCQMHHAVDCLYQSHFVFPDLNELRCVQQASIAPPGCVKIC